MKTILPCPRRGTFFLAVIAAALAGCFAEINAGYYPSTRIEVANAAATVIDSHTEPTVMFGFNMGFYLDLYGFGASYGVFGEDTVRGAEGLPDHFGGKGRWLRLDADIPWRFAHGWIGPRATYAYESYSKAKVGPNIDRANDTVAGGGSAHFGGIALAVPGNDFSIALGARTFSMHSAAQGLWPAFRTSGTGPAVRIMIRWIPTGALWAAYEPSPSKPQAESACPHPNTKTVCSYGPSGHRCQEQFTCN